MLLLVQRRWLMGLITFLIGSIGTGTIKHGITRVEHVMNSISVFTAFNISFQSSCPSIYRLSFSPAAGCYLCNFGDTVYMYTRWRCDFPTTYNPTNTSSRNSGGTTGGTSLSFTIKADKD
jgi:hypothetical protein